LAVWWVALHGLVVAALLVLAAPWLLEALGSLTVLVHAIALAPERALRVVYRRDGRVAVPELALDELTLGPRTLYTRGWVRFDLCGAGRRVETLLLVDQVSPEVWRTLQAELRRFRTADGNARSATQS
jgi:hypothetical protein